jgi:hypothetical protein
MRYHLPDYVKAMLTEVESYGGETCEYYTIVPRLQAFVNLMKVNKDYTYPRTEHLISLIESARRSGVPISRPWTYVEERDLRRAEQERENARVQRMYAHQAMLIQRTENCEHECDSDGYDDSY